jgi:hypothetical protein
LALLGFSSCYQGHRYLHKSPHKKVVWYRMTKKHLQT